MCFSTGEQFKHAIYLLIKKGCSGYLKKEKISGVLTELVASHPQCAPLIVESFVLMDEMTTIRAELREKFVAIVKSVDGILNVMFVERLNSDNLGELGAVPNKKLFNTKFIRLKTKL